MGWWNLTQDIGMAYVIAEDCIPYALARNISRQPNLTQHGKDFRKVMRYCQEAIENRTARTRHQIREIKEAMKQSRLMDKQKMHNATEIEKSEAAS